MPPGRPRTREPRTPKNPAAAAPESQNPEATDAQVTQAPERGVGRPSNLPKIDQDMVTRFAAAGLTNEQIIELIGVSKTSFYEYLAEYPEFADSLKRGQGESIEKAKRTLFQRATGYTHPEEKIFREDGKTVRVQTLKHYAPDTTALIFYLINKAGGEFKDVRHIQAAGSVNLNHKGTIQSGLMDDLNKALMAMGERPSMGAAPVSAGPRSDVRPAAASPTPPRASAQPAPDPEPDDTDTQDERDTPDKDALTFTPSDYDVQRPSIPLDLSDLESE